MTKWIRFEHAGRVDIGTLDGGTIAIHTGDMFAGAAPTNERIELAGVKVLTPCSPSKMVCLWNNFAANAKKQNLPKPAEPLWFLKAPSAYLAHGDAIKRPPSYSGKIVYEGELGIVIGKRCSNVSEEDAPGYIFGYTCVNDVTAIDLLNKDPTFAQWVRSKSFDSFGVFGPVIAAGLDPMSLNVRTVLNGAERQNYPVSDMFFPPAKLVSLLSKDVTLMPGDVIACGTSVGVGVMSGAENTIEISIEGIGSLSNRFAQTLPSEYLLGTKPKPIRICVVGAGAIGGLIAAKLAHAGNGVTVIDVGTQLAAIRKNGLKLHWQDGKEFVAKVRGAASAAEAGPQDLIILAVKAHVLENVAGDIDAMLQPDTAIMTVQNGLPWWYFERLGGQFDGQRLTSLDPSGVLLKKIDPARIVG